VNESFAETVAAFANGAGGVILVGVTDDSKVMGFDPVKMRDQIVDIVRTYVSDPVAVQVERVVANRKPVWVVTVPAQPETAKPFRCNGRVMVRALGTTRVATTSEHRALVSESTRDSRLGRPW
jgi:predicted HTH transcriptional regulator